MSVNGERSIGLCLSGGGFRASFYSLGVLRYLAEAGVLCDARVVCGVSGGSIVAAALLAGVAADPQALSDELFLRHVFEPFTTTVTSTDFRNRALWLWARQRPSPRGQPRNVVLSDVLAQALYPGAGALASLPPRPQLIVTATDLAAGRAFRFSQGFVGSFDWGYAPTPADLPLASAVAASAAAPPVFPPLQVTTAHLGLRDPSAALSLTDGGVYDNIGVEWFQGWSAARRPQGALCADFLIVVNASGPLSLARRSFTGLGALNRSRKVQYAQTQATRVRWLVADFEAGVRHGVYLGITGDPRRYRLPDGSAIAPELYKAALPSSLIGPLAGLRTDLNRFSHQEAGLLSYHGYHSAHARLASLHPDLALTTPRWREYAGIDERQASALERELTRPRHRLGIGARLR
jgi:NTE family protein